MSYTTLEVARAMRLASDLLATQPVIPIWIQDIIDWGEKNLDKHEEVFIAGYLDGVSA